MEVPKQPKIIADRYELQSLIGEGGMASVWRARDLTLERPVAVKLLFARDERDKQRLVQQFVREARIAASVHHRNVINIVDFGTTEGQQPFMVMELLEGENLGQRLHRQPRLAISEILYIASLTLRGLAAVHEAGIIHRDLKPDNVFLTHDGADGLFPKILDFGISRSVEPRSGRRSALTTREGMIVGTPEYMSPEQARGVRNIDKRTDIYGIGAILYEALTGKVAFTSENVGDLIIQIVTGTVQPVHEVNPEVPRVISDVVARAMSRLPEDRFPDAPSMQQALLVAAAASLDDELKVTLSDVPPPPSQSLSVPRASVERLRTLEFAVEEARVDGRAKTLPKVTSLPDVEPPVERGVESPISLGPNRRRAALIGALALSLAAGTALLLLRGPQAPVSGALAKNPGEPTAPGATAPATDTAKRDPVPAEPTTITVSLRNLPKTALVSVDGQPASGDTLELPRDGRNRAIKVTAPGKVPWQAVHHASADATYDVALVDGEYPAAAARGNRSTDTPHAPTATQRKVYKKPPSALKKLDF